MKPWLSFMHLTLLNHAGKRREAKIEQTGQPPWHILMAMDEQWTEYFQLDRSIISTLRDVLAKNQAEVSHFSPEFRQSTPLFEKAVFIGKQIWNTKFKYRKRIKQNVKKQFKINHCLTELSQHTLSLHFLNDMNEEHNSLLNNFDSFAFCLHFLYPTERYTIKLSETWVFLFPNHSFCQFFILSCFASSFRCKKT